MKKRLADFIFSTDPLRIDESPSQFAGKDLALRALSDFEIALEETELELQELDILPPDDIELTDFRKGGYSEEVLGIVEELYKDMGEIREYIEGLAQYEYPGMRAESSIALDTKGLATVINRIQKGTLEQRRAIGRKIASAGMAYISAIGAASLRRPRGRGYGGYY